MYLFSILKSSYRIQFNYVCTLFINIGLLVTNHLGISVCVVKVVQDH